MNTVISMILTYFISLNIIWMNPSMLLLNVDDDSVLCDEIMKLYTDLYNARNQFVAGGKTTESMKEIEHYGKALTEKFIDSKLFFKNNKVNNIIYKIPTCDYDFTKLNIKPSEVYKVAYFTLSNPIFYLGYDLAKVDIHFRIALLPLFGISKVITIKTTEDQKKVIDFIKNCKAEIIEYKQRFPDAAVGAIENMIQIIGICAEVGYQRFFSRILIDAPKPGQRVIIIDIDSSNCLNLVNRYRDYRYDDGKTLIYFYGNDSEFSKKFTSYMESNLSTKCLPLSSAVRHRDSSLFFQALRAVIIECDNTENITVDLLRRKLYGPR